MAPLDTSMYSANSELDVTPILVLIEENIVRIPGRRPVGSMRKKRKQDDLALVAAMNEIAFIFKEEKVNAKRINKCVKKGRLTKIIKR